MSPLRRLITLGCAGLFGAILIFLSPGKMLLAVGGTGLALSIFRQPRLGLLLFAFFATAVPFSTVQLGIRITLSEAMLAFACLGTGWHLILGRKTWSPGLTERRLLRLMGFSVLPFVVGQLTVLAEGNGPVNWLRWLLNLTNDAWYGRSSAPRQHLDLAVLRAVEQGVWRVRATNTGISAAVDPAGRIVAPTPLFVAARHEAALHPPP